MKDIIFKHAIFIIIGLAGVALGTYLGKRSKMKK